MTLQKSRGRWPHEPANWQRAQVVVSVELGLVLAAQPIPRRTCAMSRRRRIFVAAKKTLEQFGCEVEECSREETDELRD